MITVVDRNSYCHCDLLIGVVETDSDYFGKRIELRWKSALVRVAVLERISESFANLLNHSDARKINFHPDGR